MTREADSHAARLQELERQVMRLYEYWPEREACQAAARPLSFFVWLESLHPHLAEAGAFGARGTYRHISALIARWESLHGEVERTS
jgi:hypothetical protein